jgi:hypothetical protein
MDKLPLSTVVAHYDDDDITEGEFAIISSAPQTMRMTRAQMLQYELEEQERQRQHLARQQPRYAMSYDEPQPRSYQYDERPRPVLRPSQAPPPPQHPVVMISQHVVVEQVDGITNALFWGMVIALTATAIVGIAVFMISWYAKVPPM